MNITYRILPPDEFYKAKELFDKLFPGMDYPSPEVASVFVAECEGEVVAFWFLQLCAHAEPVGVSPQFSGLVDLHKLLKTLHDNVSNNGAAGMEYYIYTATPEWDKTLQKNGFTPIGFAYKSMVP